MKKFIITLFIILGLFYFTLPSNAFEITGPGNESSDIKPKDIVAELSIYSAVGGSGSSSSSSNAWYTGATGLHSYLVVKNISTISYTIAGYTLAPDKFASYRTWDYPTESGVWINRELVSYSDKNSCNLAYLKKTITMYQVTTLSAYICSHDYWTLENNCSTFAVDIWNTLCEDSLLLTAYDSFLRHNTPKVLYESILSKPKHMEGLEYPKFSTYGYLSEDKKYVVYNG